MTITAYIEARAVAETADESAEAEAIVAAAGYAVERVDALEFIARTTQTSELPPDE